MTNFNESLSECRKKWEEGCNSIHDTHAWEGFKSGWECAIEAMNMGESQDTVARTLAGGECKPHAPASHASCEIPYNDYDGGRGVTLTAHSGQVDTPSPEIDASPHPEYAKGYEDGLAAGEAINELRKAATKPVSIADVDIKLSSALTGDSTDTISAVLDAAGVAYVD